MKNNTLLVKNTISSLVFQISTIICGFIVPRLILKSYGSEVNGLVNSITQFLAFISFLEFGVGAVVQSSLYKPLAEKDRNGISTIVVSANNFFRRLAQILLVYICGLIVIYPRIVNDSFDWVYTVLLIISISISSFAQYYFGVVDRLLLTSDQKGYIQYNAQTATLVLNTIACYVLIEFEASIHLVKLTTSLIYLLRPMYLRWFVNHNYTIDRNIHYSGEPIKQKWNGVAQHLAAVVLDGTPLILLTLLDSLKAVSIYTTYFLVVSGIKQLFIASTNGIQALLGELWAKQNIPELKRFFSWTEWILHNLTVFLFGCTGCLIVPFVLIYTNGVNDTNYYQPAFAAILVTSHALHCFRLPYNLMILAAGHYKQTQNNYIIATILNLSVSVIAVKVFGFIGVALGALCALSYQVFWMARYNSCFLITQPLRIFFKQIVTDMICVLLALMMCQMLDINYSTFFTWSISAIKVSGIWIFSLLIVNSVMYKEELNKVFTIVKNKAIYILKLGGG